MKVCFFINSLTGSAGTERMTVLLANYLANNGYQVDIITKQGGDSSFFTLNNNIKHHYLFRETGINIYTSYGKGLKRYSNLIKKINPDYIVDVCVAMSLMTLPAITFKSKIKVISWEHFNANAYFNFVTAKLSKWLASKFAYSVVVLTTTDKDAYIKKFKPRRIAVIKNPVTADISSKSDLNSKYVLSIGRLTEQKGFDMLLNSWKILSPRAPGWKLRIIGDGELKPVLKRQCSDLLLTDSVEFVEPTLQVGDYYLSSSIFAMSSRFEGLPLVLIEAKSYGLPIVSFDCETGPREIIRNGVDGVLVPANNVELLAESILDLIDNPDKRFIYGMNSQDNLGDYSQESFYDSWKQLFDKKE